MKIPKEIKIGGKIYVVQETSFLDLGSANCSGEIDYLNCVIRVCPASKAQMETTFLHEMIHGIYSFLGYTDHDEHHIDELANVLHMVIMDNPKIFNSKEK